MTTRMPYPYALADAEAFLARAADIDSTREVNWVVDAGEGALGVLGLFTDRSTDPELGYWLGRPAWGRGYATEAAETALDWCDQVWRRPRVVASCFIDNPGSIRVLEKCGFVDTGVVEMCWSLARGGETAHRSFVRQARTSGEAAGSR